MHCRGNSSGTAFRGTADIKFFRGKVPDVERYIIRLMTRFDYPADECSLTPHPFPKKSI